MNFSVLSTEIQKILTKLSKEKNCEIIGRWRKACVRHFYWAVTSTQECLGKVKVAKFQAFLSHVTNKHKDLPNRLFNACVHGDVIRPKVWMSKGSNTGRWKITVLYCSNLFGCYHIIKKLLQDNDHVDIIFQFRTVIFDLMQGI